MATFEVWSITTANRYAETFTDEAAARRVLVWSQEAWPEDEFGILRHEGDDAVWLDDDDDRAALASESAAADGQGLEVEG